MLKVNNSVLESSFEICFYLAYFFICFLFHIFFEIYPTVDIIIKKVIDHVTTLK